MEVLNPAGAQSTIARPHAEPDFDDWVSRRLADWPSAQLVDFERWLREEGCIEFLPAVSEARRRRRISLVAPDRRWRVAPQDAA
jgi:hypothetical protein